MEKNQGKFLVQWLNSFTHQQLFFLFWAVLIVFFVYLFMRQSAKLDQRQFKPGGQSKGEPKGKGLVLVEKSEKIVVNKNKN